MPVLIALIVLISVVGGISYAAFARFLAHRERMAALEARRPHVVLALPPGEPANTDEITDAILEACKQKGIDVDLELRG